MNIKSKKLIKALKISSLFLIILAIISTTNTLLTHGEKNTTTTKAENNPEVQKINQEIQARKDALDKIKSQQKFYQEQIQQKQSEQASLNSQLSILEDRLANAQLDIDKVNNSIEETNLEIKRSTIKINEKKDEIQKEKEQLANSIKLLGKQDNKTDLEILLLNDYFTEYLDQIKYLEDINQGIGKSLESLKANYQELEENKKTLIAKNNDLVKLQQDLADKKTSLVEEQGSKNSLLEETKNSEEGYQKLLAQAKSEQAAANSDIASAEKRMRAKIAELEKKSEKKDDKGNNVKNENKTSNGSTSLAWPVPKNTITAYFHDPEYPFRRVFEHPAIDIRASQGTTLRAAASGFVARVQSGGARGYGYIMLIHDNGLATVYGHISRIDVKEEDYVSQGQIIGASGGMPGTPGAGPFTTGAHLHFEVRLNGIPVNPSSYLP